MKRYFNILSIIALALATFSCGDKTGRQFCDERIFTPDYEKIHETEPHFIITPEKKIIFPANEDGKFKLIEYNKGRIKALNFPFDYVINPMMIGDEIAGLYDRNSDEKYRFTSGRIDKFLHARVIRSARSSPKGNYLLYVPEGQNELHMIDLTAMEDVFISGGVAKTNHICFDPSEKYFVFPQTDRVFLYDLHKKRLKEVPTGLNGKKLNLYAVNDLLYFVNNDTSEFYSIYSVGLSGQKNRSELVMALDRDLRLPKRQGDKLFFLGVDAGEYLLYCRNTKTGKVRQLTKRGVVFDYQFYGQKIVYSYGDFITPKCLKILDIHTGKTNMVYGSEQDFGMTYSYIDNNRIRSGAWVFSPPDSVKTKGTVLYIHHGLHSDFSPRWENMLMGICLNGYRIITPNYPGSCGYGKSYKNKDLNEALRDLISWKKYIVETFNNNPFYCISVSSGNILLEYLLAAEPKKIMAAVSFIGVPSGRDPLFNCLVLYILGERDPTVPFEARRRQLAMAAERKNIKIESYPDEGHGIRDPDNMVDLIEKIICFYNKSGSN